jgi:hypothetical protein
MRPTPAPQRNVASVRSVGRSRRWASARRSDRRYLVESNRIESNRIESNWSGVEWSGVGWSGAAIDERAIYSLKYAMRFRTLSSLLHQSGTSDAIGYLLSALVNR